MPLQHPFQNRAEAGRLLAEELRHLGYADRPDVLSLALPRGGVPVAYEVARSLHVPLDVFIVRKLGVPGQEELAMGAIAAGGIRILNEQVVRMLGIPQQVIDQAAHQEQAEVERRQRLYRGHHPPVRVRGRTVIVVDDGLATGSTMRAAVTALRSQNPSKIVVAVPVAAQETCEKLRHLADEVVCLLTPEPFRSVGLWYENFSQTSDEEVRKLLQQAWRPPGPTLQPTETRAVRLPADGVELNGDLALPDEAGGLVLFAHGSGSSRHSSRNKLVASELNHVALATLLFDLLTEAEEEQERYTRHLRFDIPLLARRLVAVTDWAKREPRLRELPIGYFGASTGGAAALVAAAAHPDAVAAVVSRGGRPDLAADALPHVQASTLLIVGGQDPAVIGMNQEAMAQLQCEKKLRIIPGATHLFEEPGALEEVAHLAREWFDLHLKPSPAMTAPP